MADLIPGSRYLGRDGEAEYLVTDKGDQESVWVVALNNGKMSLVHRSTELRAGVNWRLRIAD